MSWMSSIRSTRSSSSSADTASAPGRVDSPAHIGEFQVDVLERLTVGEVMEPDQNVASVLPGASFESVLEIVAESDQEAYPVVERILQTSGRPITRVIGDRGFLRTLEPNAYTNEHFGLPTVKDILAELEKPGRDPRPEFKTALFQDGVEQIGDLQPGMVLAIEPMVNAGKRHVKLLPDRWTVVTKDRKPSAQWEHTLLVTADGHEVLTLRSEEAAAS